MGKQRHTAEQIIAKLREAEVLQGKGMPLEEVLRQIGISDATYYKWRKEYGGLRLDQAKKLWENGYIESFNGKLRDEQLNGEIFDTVLEARVVTEDWRGVYNTLRPHSSLGYRAPAPEAFILHQVANA